MTKKGRATHLFAVLDIFADACIKLLLFFYFITPVVVDFGLNKHLCSIFNVSVIINFQRLLLSPSYRSIGKIVFANLHICTVLVSKTTIKTMDAKLKSQKSMPDHNIFHIACVLKALKAVSQLLQ